MDFERLAHQYLTLTLEYKEKYDNEKWYNFKKKRHYKIMYKSGLDMVSRVSDMHIKFGSDNKK